MPKATSAGASPGGCHDTATPRPSCRNFPRIPSSVSRAGSRRLNGRPLADVDQSVLRPTATSTYCPYKGDASYYSLTGPAAEIEDAIWTYAEPYPAVAEIAGYLAFYPDRVEISAGAGRE